MSDLPEGWEWTTLYDVADWGSGGTPKRTVPRYFGGDVPWAVIGDLNDGVVMETEETITEAGLGSSSAKLVPEGAVLLAMYGSIGKLGIAGRPIATNQAIAFAVPHPGVLDARYLFHFLYAQRPSLSAVGKGATQKNISQTVLRSWPVPLPPYREQERIVAAIEEHFPRLDAAEAATAAARRRLSGFYDAVLHATFDRTWAREPLDSLSDPDRPICYGILKPRTPEPGEVPYVEVRSIAKGRIKLDALHRTTMALHREFQRSELRPGDVTLAIRGSFDRAAVVPHELTGANVSRDVARIAPTDRLLPEFLSAFLVSPEARRYFRAHARGVAVQGINIGDLRRLPVPAPSLEQQTQAVRQVAEATTGMDHIDREIRMGGLRSGQLRGSILAAAFSGRLVPQDRNDEPASVLLDRIRAERAAAGPTKRTRRAKTS